MIPRTFQEGFWAVLWWSILNSAFWNSTVRGMSVSLIFNEDKRHKRDKESNDKEAEVNPVSVRQRGYSVAIWQTYLYAVS